MKVQLLLFLTVLTYCYLPAQTTAIPDADFEQVLINIGVDSDATVNGQVLTADIDNLTALTIINTPANPYISDLTGIEDFTNLQHLTINWTEITELDLSQNTQLLTLDCKFNALTALDVSSNTLLEELHCGNESDIGPFNDINELDLSNNPNIHTLTTFNNIPDIINLANGNNNSNMAINVNIDPWPGYDPDEIYGNVCITVDNATGAQNNQAPYSDWDILHSLVEYNFSSDCSLSIDKNKPVSVAIYPNPVSDVLFVETTNTAVEKLSLFDVSGKVVVEKAHQNSLNVSSFEKGLYFLKVVLEHRVETKKIVVE